MPMVQVQQTHEQESSPSVTSTRTAPDFVFINNALQLKLVHPLGLATQKEEQQQQQQQPFMSLSTECASSFTSKRNKRRSTWTTTTFSRSSFGSSVLTLIVCNLALLASSTSEPLQGQQERHGGRIVLLVDAASSVRATTVFPRSTTTTASITTTRYSSSSSSPSAGAPLPSLLHDIRGGSIDPSDTVVAANLADDDNIKKEAQNNNENHGEENGPTTNDQEQQQQQQPQANSNKFWPVGDLFRLYDTVKGEALSLEQQLQGEPRDHDENEDNDTLNHRGGRGGAAVAVAAQEQLQQQQQANKRFQWFGSSSEAPLSSRLLPEDDNAQEQTMEEQLQQQQEQQQARPATKWGNVGMQFVPDGVQDSELDFLDEEEDDDDDDEHDEYDNDDDADEESLPSSNSRKQDRGATTKMNENDQALMEVISHLKPDGYDDSKQQQQQVTVVSVAEAIDENEKEKYIKGAHIVTELPLADASLTKEQEAALSLFPDSSASTGASADDTTTTTVTTRSPYASSGIWPVIDYVLTAGYSYSHPAWKLSPKLRPIRKVAARVTGLHGVLSGKQRIIQQQEQLAASKQVAASHYKHLDMVKRRLAAIDRARQNLHRVEGGKRKRSPIFGGWFQHSSHPHHDDIHYAFVFENTDIEETQRRRRVQEIDKLMADGQRDLLQLATEKDILQRRPNPLWTYKTKLEELDEARRVEAAMHHNYSTTHGETVVPTRLFTFPPKDLVDDYLELLFVNERLVKMNHTDLWRNDAAANSDDDLDHYDDYDADEEDEWFFGASSLSLSSKSRSKNRQQRGRPQQQQKQQQQRRNVKNDGHYYYGNANRDTYNSKNRNNNNNNDDEAGSFWLRNGIGEKIGDAVETAAYKAVCQAVMSFLARLLSSLHGINVMGYSDIRLFAEEAPEFPDNDTDEFRRARREAFSAAMRRGAKSSSKKRRKRAASTLSDFMQRDAVVETLLSQSQIAAPLLKVFPLNWQRALLSNIVTLVTCVMADFVEGLEFQILGHRLSFAFAPITEEDMIRHLHMVGTTSHGSNNLFYHRRYKSKDGTNDNHSPERFEEAVRATARDLSLELNFLDKWHERALGGEMLKTQIATLIARLVLSLVDEILCGARMDLWTTHAGGPRLVAGLEYRRNNTAATIPGATKTMTTTTTTSTSSQSSR